jgi:site-specific DNA-methyltransferase (adenine-specific)
MKLYSENDSYKIYNGDMLDMLQVIKPESIDAIVCDPPYELGFMNKSWDSTGIAFKKETWENCLKVLKPGGYLLAFGGSRTYHRIACAIEDAGFEIRDCVMYLYGTGFPKSCNIGLAIDKKNGVDNRTGNIRTDGVNNQNICYDFKAMKPKFEERIAQNKWQGWGTCLKPAYEPIIVARKPFKGSVVDNIIKYRVGGLNIDELRIEYKENKYFFGKLER